MLHERIEEDFEDQFESTLISLKLPFEYYGINRKEIFVVL
jgi:hypothetical protein